jgi:hypothetical protein
MSRHGLEAVHLAGFLDTIQLLEKGKRDGAASITGRGRSLEFSPDVHSAPCLHKPRVNMSDVQQRKAHEVIPGAHPQSCKRRRG